MLESEDITGKTFKQVVLSVPYNATPAEAAAVHVSNQTYYKQTLKDVTTYMEQPKVIVAYAKAGITTSGKPISQEKTLSATVDGVSIPSAIAQITKGNSGIVLLAIIAIFVVLIVVSK